MDWFATLLLYCLYVLLGCGALLAVMVPLYLLGVLIWGVSMLTAGVLDMTGAMIGMFRDWRTRDESLLRE